MKNVNKNNHRELDELEKFLLTHKSKLEKESSKIIDNDFDTSFSMEKNFLAIQEKLQKEQSTKQEARKKIEEKAKIFKQETENWVKPAPFESFEETMRKENDPASWVKPSPVPSKKTELQEKSTIAVQTKTISLRKFWSVAASLTALLVSTLVYHIDTVSVLNKQNEEQQDLIALYETNTDAENNVAVAASLPAELIEAENYYTSIIAKDKKELKEKDKKNWVTPETIQTLEELDEAYQVMKNDLLEEQNPKKLIDEMLENLKLRKQILDESIQLLEETQSRTESNTSNNKNT